MRRISCAVAGEYTLTPATGASCLSKVTGITFYENELPGTAALNQFKQIRWEDAPTPPH